MSVDFAISVSQQALWVAVMLLAPLLGAALLVGLLVSIFQAVTQINELTLTFIPKIAVVVLVMFLLLPWFLAVMVQYARDTFSMLGGM